MEAEGPPASAPRSLGTKGAEEYNPAKYQKITIDPVSGWVCEGDPDGQPEDTYARMMRCELHSMEPQHGKALDGSEGYRQKGNTGEVEAPWRRSRTMFEVKDLIVARIARVLLDDATALEPRANLADELWTATSAVDRRGVLLEEQLDPNKAVWTREGVALARCAACGQGSTVENEKFWSKASCDKIKDRLTERQNRIRSGLKCIACTERWRKSKIKALRCHECDMVKDPDQFSRSQKRSSAMRCISCVGARSEGQPTDATPDETPSAEARSVSPFVEEVD
jgi:hypothetical protein